VLQKLFQRRLFYVVSAALFYGMSPGDRALAQNALPLASGVQPASSAAVNYYPGGARRTADVSRPQSPGAIANGLSERPAEQRSLAMIAPQAQAHIDYALNLAERGAVQSAQAEFIMALDLIADSLDADMRDATRAHARAVQAGLIAIEESKDFVPADTPHDIAINLSQLAATHQTPVLKNIDLARMTRAEALQGYHSYATQQLAFAGGRSTIASSALYGLGRAASVSAAGASCRNPLGAPNAMAFYQAALLVDPQNYLAANELGVLLARYGDLESAAGQLVNSLSIKPQVETWHNLAVVYKRMGQSAKAEQAEQQRAKLLAAPRDSVAAAGNPGDLGSRPVLRWVDADTFAASSPQTGFDGPTVTNSNPGSPAKSGSLGKRLVSKLMPWRNTDKTTQNAGSTQTSQQADQTASGNADGRALLK
jgi:tetratricopeptide (TPR) repeat protein